MKNWIVIGFATAILCVMLGTCAGGGGSSNNSKDDDSGAKTRSEYYSEAEEWMKENW